LEQVYLLRHIERRGRGRYNRIAREEGQEQVYLGQHIERRGRGRYNRIAREEGRSRYILGQHIERRGRGKYNRIARIRSRYIRTGHGEETGAVLEARGHEYIEGVQEYFQ
jgi:hypothetical protein